MGYVAEPFVAGTPEAEVVGQIVLAFAENLEADVVEPLLPKHGLGDIDPEAWYKHQQWFDVLKEVETNEGGQASSTFVAFGRAAVEKAVMPPEIKTIPQVLNLLHDIHHMNLRNIPEEEGYTIEQVAPGHVLVLHNTPNPDDAIYGFLWGLASRFKGENESFRVTKVDNHAPDKCRSVFEVKWGRDV